MHRQKKKSLLNTCGWMLIALRWSVVVTCAMSIKFNSICYQYTKVETQQDGLVALVKQDDSFVGNNNAPVCTA